MSSHEYQVGEQVRWNSDAGHITGKITKIHVKDFEFMGRMRRCSQDKPQYEVTSDRTGHHAVHLGSALTRTGD